MILQMSVQNHFVLHVSRRRELDVSSIMGV